MSNYYAVQHGVTLLDAVTLTASLSGNVATVQQTAGIDQATLYCSYTPKAGQSNRTVSVRVEYSPDNSTWYLDSNASVASSTTAITQNTAFTFLGATGGTAYNFVIDVPMSHKFTRISACEDGSGNFGTLSLTMGFSGQ